MNDMTNKTAGELHTIAMRRLDHPEYKGDERRAAVQELARRAESTSRSSGTQRAIEELRAAWSAIEGLRSVAFGQHRGDRVELYEKAAGCVEKRIAALQAEPQPPLPERVAELRKNILAELVWEDVDELCALATSGAVLAKKLAEAQAERDNEASKANHLRAELLRVAVAAGVFYETDGSGPVRAPTDAVVAEIEKLVKDRAASDRLRHIKDDLLRIASKVGITYLADYTEEVPGPTDSIIRAIVAIQTREHEARRSLDTAQDKCDRFMRGMQAMLVAAGASEDIDTQERQCNEAGPKPSDFVRKAFADLRGKLGDARQEASAARKETRAVLLRLRGDIGSKSVKPNWSSEPGHFFVRMDSVHFSIDVEIAKLPAQPATEGAFDFLNHEPDLYEDKVPPPKALPDLRELLAAMRSTDVLHATWAVAVDNLLRAIVAHITAKEAK